MRRALAALALSAVALLVLAGPAGAHANLDASTPSSGAVLEASPDELVLRFDQVVTSRPDSIRLHDASGGTVDLSSLERADGGRTLRVPVEGLDDGGYVVTFRVVSEDGHPINGGVTWRIGSASAEVDESLLEELLNAEEGGTALRIAAAVVRALLFGSLLLLVGGLLLLVTVWPAGAGDDRLRPTLRAAAAVAALATVVGMGIQGAEVAGAGLAHAFTPGAGIDTLDSDFGKAGAARLVLLVVLAALAAVASRWVRDRRWQLAVLVASSATLLTLTLAGHARTGRWLALAVPVDLLHLGAAAVWIGGLAVIATIVLPRADEAAEAVVERFSRVAALAVGVVVVTGAVQGLRQVGDIEGLRTTGYGRLLVMKVVVVALVVVLGALSRSLVRARRRLADDPVEPDEDVDPVEPEELQRALRRSVGAEALIAVVVLGLTSLLVAADPARSVEETAVAESKVVQGTIIEVIAAPARPGPVDVHVYVSDPTLGLTAQLGVTADLSLPGGGIEGIEVPLRPAGRGHWSAYDLDIPIRGNWRIAVTVTIGRFDSRQAELTIPID